jgi:hypothetical protein
MTETEESMDYLHWTMENGTQAPAATTDQTPGPCPQSTTISSSASDSPGEDIELPFPAEFNTATLANAAAELPVVYLSM